MSVPTLAPNNQLNVQGVHVSNISASPILTSYPSSTTGTSLGHYHFVDSTNASNHLNVSNNKVGGHIFSHASATEAPKEMLKIDRDIMTVNTVLLRNSNAKTALNFDVNRLNLVDPTRANLVSELDGEKLYITDANLATNSYVRGGNVETSDDINRKYSKMTPTELKIEDVSNNDIALLTVNDLTFNGVSIFTSFSDNAKKHVVSNITVSSPAIYADSSIAPQPSPFLATYGYSGWAYKKESPQPTNAKINWYFPFPIIGGTVGDLKGLYYQIFNDCSGTGDLPFFVVYTRPTGSGDYASWYHSSRAYTPTSNSTANQTCQMYANIKGLSFTPNSIAIQNQINMTEAITNGTYVDSDVILFIAFGTNSGSALNAVDFSCTKIGMITDNYSAEYLLI
jgi:hypothetical protein